MVLFMTDKRFTPLLLSFLLLLSACQNSFDEPDDLTVFRYNEDGNISSLDPLYARNQSNIWATSQIFNGLVQLDQNLNVMPAIAKEWTVSNDGITYTFYLRNDVYFHESEVFGEKLTRKVNAEDFVYSFSRIVDPKLNSPGLWVMNPLARQENGKPDVKAINDTVLQIRLKEPFPPFLGLLCMQYCSVVPMEATQRQGSEFRKNPVGTGPFYFKFWKEGVKLVLRKNPRYFEFEDDQRLPYTDAIAITFIMDRQTAFLEFVKGNLDILTRIDASYKDELLTQTGQLREAYQERFYKITQPFLNTEYLGLLLDREGEKNLSPFQQQKIRLAINHAFDREKMLFYLRNNVGTPAHAGFVPVGMPGFSENTGGYAYNPEKARQYLAEAGFPEGKGLPAFEISTNSQYLDITQFIQHELKKTGIPVTINVMPSATLREMMAKGESEIFRASWIADYPDAENYLALFYSKNKTPSGPNYTFFDNKEFDKLYEKSLTIVNDSLRHVYYHKMDSIVVEHAPVVPLFYDQSLRFLPHYVTNLKVNPLNQMDLKRVKVRKDDQ